MRIGPIERVIGGKMEHFDTYINILKVILDKVEKGNIKRITALLSMALEEENNIFVAGNGGSAATAAHFVTDLVKGSFYDDNIEENFRAFCLSDNTSLVTAIGNDCGYKEIFADKIKYYGMINDLLICISVSGKSKNLIRAAKVAKTKGMNVVSLTGEIPFIRVPPGSKKKIEHLVDYSDFIIEVPHGHFGTVEDIHSIILHEIAYYFKEI